MVPVVSLAAIGMRAVTGRVAGVRGAATAATLVEQDDPVGGRVEVPGPPGWGARAGTAVHHLGRLAVGVAAHRPVDGLSVTDVKHPLRVRLDLRVAGHAGHPVIQSYRLPVSVSDTVSKWGA